MTVIGRLRIRSKSSDPQAEQQRISRMLRAATLHPAALPHSALLIVRRLVDPLPSRLRAGPFDAVPDSSWQRAVIATLEKLAGSAVRPAYGFVPVESNAVLFYDRAEVLAALAFDWLSGSIASQWWWREFLSGRDGIAALFHEWTQSPEYVPAAIELLAQQERVVQFVQRLPEPVVEEMLEAIANVHGVPRPNLEQIFPQPDPGHQEEQSETGNLVSVKTTTPHRISMIPAPWAQCIPEAATPGLSTPQKMLLIQALMLRRASTTARTLSFQKALLQWQTTTEHEDKENRQAQKHGARPLRASAKPGQVTPELLETTSDVAGQTASQAPPLVSTDASGPRPPSPNELVLRQRRRSEMTEPIHVSGGSSGNERRQPREDGDRKSSNQEKNFTDSNTEGPSIRPQEVHAQELTERIEPSAAALLSPEPIHTAADIRFQDSLQPSVTLETEYGGVFFLLGLALYLNIYTDFTRPAETGMELAIWDFLALMASQFTGRMIETDPLWSELAALAGRTSAESPGLAFDPPNEWQLPSDWLDAFPETYNHNRILINGRLILSHPAGFKVLDVPAGVAEERAVEESEPVDRLQRWVGWMSAYLRARLARALGREDAAEFLCHRRARVSLTLTHLDVTFSLDHHPIGIRIAGLDRDLGWIPAAGRYVAFHFE